MPDGQGFEAGLRGAGRGLATVVLAAGGYLALLLALAWLASWTSRVV